MGVARYVGLYCGCGKVCRLVLWVGVVSGCGKVCGSIPGRNWRLVCHLGSCCSICVMQCVYAELHVLIWPED